MAGINPISNVGPSPLTPPLAAAAKGDQAAGKAGFGETLRGYLNQVDGDQQASAGAVQDLLAGKSQDVLPVVAAMAKADLSFKLLMGIRNKVIEAYKQTMNMQV